MYNAPPLSKYLRCAETSAEVDSQCTMGDVKRFFLAPDAPKPVPAPNSLQSSPRGPKASLEKEGPEKPFPPTISLT
jgi:hypothetical protein